MKKLFENFKKFLTEAALADYNNNGTMTLYHYAKSKDNVLILDPKYFLSGRNTFTRNDFQASGLPRVFFYVNLDHAEDIVKQSRTLYTAVVNVDKVYDITKDPAGLKKEARNWPTNIYGEPIKTAPSSLNMDLLLRGIAENYSGAFYETNGMDVVVWFEPIEVYEMSDVDIQNTIKENNESR